MLRNILIYGGSFDPPHLGHINTARAVQRHIYFEHFIFLPCKTPILKNATTATAEQRVQMLKLAIEPYPEFEIDLREIQRETPSYMVNTLQSFRDELGPQASITLLLGMDAFMQLPEWHDWKNILKFCHLIVIKRAEIDDQTMSKQLKSLLNKHEVFDKTELFNHAYGKIYQSNAGEYAISSSDLRQKMKAGKDVRCYLSDVVYHYINKHKIYAP